MLIKAIKLNKTKPAKKNTGVNLSKYIIEKVKFCINHLNTFRFGLIGFKFKLIVVENK
jgi:hypothetical protein